MQGARGFAVLALGLSGIFIFLIGLVLTQYMNSLGITPTFESFLMNALGIKWYLLFLSSFILGSVSWIRRKNEICQYKLAIVGLCASYLGCVPQQISAAIKGAASLSAVVRDLGTQDHTFTMLILGETIIGLGLLLTILSVFATMIMVGTEYVPTSSFGKTRQRA
jgi:hypothetical protein